MSLPTCNLAIRGIQVLALLHVLFSTGCATTRTFSGGASGLPDLYATHNTGIISSPSQEDIDQAIALGAMSKHDQLYTRAYNFRIRFSSNIFVGQDIYACVQVNTPLRAVARYACDKAMAYEKVDPSVIAGFLKDKTISLQVEAEYRVYATLPPGGTVRQHRSVILLRDGVRVKEVGSSIYNIDEVNQPGNYEIVFWNPNNPNNPYGANVRKTEIRIPVDFHTYR